MRGITYLDTSYCRKLHCAIRMNEEIRNIVGRRLKEEREKLAWPQAVLADVAGVSKRSVAAWESGESAPGADVLAVLSGKGVDVLYVLTGQHTPSDAASLSMEEAALVLRYRQRSPVLRAYLQEMGAATAAGNAVTIGGDVGQSIAGDASFSAPVSFGSSKK